MDDILTLLISNPTCFMVIPKYYIWKYQTFTYAYAMKAIALNRATVFVYTPLRITQQNIAAWKAIMPPQDYTIFKD